MDGRTTASRETAPVSTSRTARTGEATSSSRAGGERVREALRPGSGAEAGRERAPAEQTVDPSALPLSVGRKTGDVIVFDSIEVPDFKLRGHRGELYSARRLRRQKAYTRSTAEGGDPAQRGKWREEMGRDTTRIVDRLEQKVRSARGGSARSDIKVDPSERYVFEGVTKHGAKRFVIGDLATAAGELTLPSWTQEGDPKSFDVDHIVELQLAGWNADSWGNTPENMELLESSANRSSGAFIRSKIEERVRGFIRAASPMFGEEADDEAVERIKRDNHLEFQEAVKGGGVSVTEQDYWTRAAIRSGRQIPVLEVRDMSVIGGQGRVLVFPDITGGQPKSFIWPDDRVDPQLERNWLTPYVITAKRFETGAESEEGGTLGALSFNIPEGHPDWLPFAGGDKEIPVRRIPGARYGGYLDRQSVFRSLRDLRQKRLSPIQVDAFDILPEGGLFIAGRILPEMRIIRGTGIGFRIRGNEMTLFKSFTSEDLSLPAPFLVRSSTLTLSMGTEQGLGIAGRVELGIDRVGEGHLEAAADTSSGFALQGAFSFDSRLFDPAELEVDYRDEELSLRGTIGIPAGRVRGIESARAEIAYSPGELQAEGTVRLTVPGLEGGELSVRYTQEEGLSIAGALSLSEDAPGLRSGEIQAEIEPKPGGAEGYRLAVDGTARPDVPGIDTLLRVSYEDGVLDVRGEASYQRGMLSGSVLIGVTNRSVDEEGAPRGEPGGELRAYGGGEVGLQLAPWLQATVGVTLLPNGEMEVSGEVGLPESLELFPEKRIEKNLFTIDLDIPIVGVAVAGQRIGIFATVGGGLDVSAGIGPGELQELGLRVAYNPEREEQTRVQGGALLVIPGHAGLRLFVRGALGAGIPVVSASAGLEIGGGLGVEGAAEAEVRVDWTPAQGLELEARGEIVAQPSLLFDITGYVLVEADLVLTTVELYSQRWELAGFEYGSGLRFGLRFPIRYVEGEPFAIDLRDVEFIVPDLEPREVLQDLVDRIA